MQSMSRPVNAAHRRVPSYQNVNKNTNFLHYPGTWSFYLGLIGFTWLIFFLLVGLSVGASLTATNLVHGVITFYIFHWHKGSPISFDQGEYDALTWWEQIDAGHQYTSNKKFLTAVPVALFVLTTRWSHDMPALLLVNTIMVAVLVIAKTPALHEVRLFGINKGIN